MIILALEGCEGCKVLRDRHPHLRYVEVPASSTGDKDVLKLKRRIKKLGIDRYPALVSDDFSTTYLISTIDPAFDAPNEMP